MARSFLTLVQQACDEMGVPTPQSIIGNTDDQVKQLLALSKREAYEFCHAANGNGGWQELHNEYSFTTVNGQSDYPFPADFASFITKTFWDGSYRWQLLGPLEAQEKQVLKYGISPVGPRRRFWILQNLMTLNPTPTTTGDVIAYDYMSKYPITTSGGVAKEMWTDDTDLYKLDEDCFILGIKWRFLRAKGMDYGEEFASYTNNMQRIMGANGGGRDLPLNSTASGINLLNNTNIPDTGFGA